MNGRFISLDLVRILTLQHCCSAEALPSGVWALILGFVISPDSYCPLLLLHQLAELIQVWQAGLRQLSKLRSHAQCMRLYLHYDTRVC